jgi:hypothetical protein
MKLRKTENQSLGSESRLIRQVVNAENEYKSGENKEKEK